MRIVSLLPSATEMLACVLSKASSGTLGPVTFVGRSHECDYPKKFVESVPVLTSQKTVFNVNSENPAKDIDEQVRNALGTSSSLYNISQQELIDLKPDVILTQSLCEVCSIDLVSVERIVHKHLKGCKVLDLNPKTLGEVMNDIVRVGEMIGLVDAALEVKAELEARIEKCVTGGEEKRAKLLVPNVLFFEWTDPIFLGGHWTPEIIQRATGNHLYNNAGNKSFRIEDDVVKTEEVDIAIIAPCGMNLTDTRKLVNIVLDDYKRGRWFRSLKAFKEGNVVLVDGNEMFNRPGPRLVECLEWCSDLFEAWRDGNKMPVSTFPAERL